MDDNQNGLDSFLTSFDTPKDSSASSQKQEKSNESKENLDLEDEFSKLLNDFITQDMGEGGLEKIKATSVSEKAPETTEASSLDNMVTSSSPQSPSLDSMASEPQVEENSGLDMFVDEQPADTTNAEQETQSFGDLDDLVTPSAEEEKEIADNPNGLKSEEQELARSVANFQDAITAISSKKNYKAPQTDYNESMLIPNYKPSIGKKIAQYLLDCWTILNKYAPQDMKRLSPNTTDEEYLNFAESLTDTYMQLAIISYVEILMNMEICENSYQQKKEEIQKRRIKKELYEEYMELQERKQIFIEKLKEKNFPIDAEKLINNYFRVAQKDPDGSFEALTKNPATFSPIQTEKLHPKFFGLIKVTPEDGIRANQKIGKFIKNLKV